mgnify:CR=1 FL=1
MWKSLKELGLPPKKGASSARGIGLIINDALYFDKLNVAEKFNLFYTTVASDLVEKLPKCISRYGKQFVMSFYADKGVLPNS